MAAKDPPKNANAPRPRSITHNPDKTDYRDFNEILDEIQGETDRWSAWGDQVEEELRRTVKRLRKPPRPPAEGDVPPAYTPPKLRKPPRPPAEGDVPPAFVAPEFGVYDVPEPGTPLSECPGRFADPTYWLDKMAQICGWDLAGSGEDMALELVPDLDVYRDMWDEYTELWDSETDMRGNTTAKYKAKRTVLRTHSVYYTLPTRLFNEDAPEPDPFDVADLAYDTLMDEGIVDDLFLRYTAEKYDVVKRKDKVRQR